MSTFLVFVLAVAAAKPSPTCVLSFDGGRCTATVVEPKLPSGKYHLLTAAHCIKGERFTATTWDGQKLACKVKAVNRQADCAWLETVDAFPAGKSLTAAKLAVPGTTDIGSGVWHHGFGTDKPGNVEKGTLVRGTDSNGQAKFNLSVSPGDSGSAIFLDGLDGEWVVLSVVCCTDSLARKGGVWGAGPAAITALRPPLDGTPAPTPPPEKVTPPSPDCPGGQCPPRGGGRSPLFPRLGWRR